MTTSTNLIAIDASTDLEIVEAFNTLMRNTTGKDSIYINAIETLGEFLEKNNMTAVDKAKYLSETIANLTVQLTQVSMTTALEWKSKEKSFQLQQLELSYALAKLNQEIEVLSMQTNTAKSESYLARAKLIKEYGIPTIVNGEVASLDDTGKISYEIEMLKEQTTNEQARNTQMKAQTEELYARVHQLVADSYINHGIFSGYAVTETGITNLTKTSVHETLSEMNLAVGKEQAKGYVINAWANASNSASSMVATLVSTESDVNYSPYLLAWKTALDNLNKLTLPFTTPPLIQ